MKLFPSWLDRSYVILMVMVLIKFIGEDNVIGVLVCSFLLLGNILFHWFKIPTSMKGKK